MQLFSGKSHSCDKGELKESDNRFIYIKNKCTFNRLI